MSNFEIEYQGKFWDSEWMRFNRSVSKLRKMQTKIKKDNKVKEKDNTPTSIDIEKWFYETKNN